MKAYYFLIPFLILFSASNAWSQQLLSGVVSDEQGISIPSVKIYVKNDAALRTLADDNGYYEMRLLEGEYFLVIAATGYEDREVYITVNDDAQEKNITLFVTKIQDLESIDFSAKKSNPGRDIMLKVVEKRDQINPWNRPHTVEGYIRATEKIERKGDGDPEKDGDKKKRDDAEETVDPDGIIDPFAEQKKEDQKLANNMNLVESNFTRHYGSRTKVKEIRNAYELRGEKRNFLYYTTTVKSNFNFFENLMHLDDLHQTPVSSPISGPGILSYKYRLDDQYMENGRKIHKIKIIPRNTSTTTLEGYIYVIDSVWLVQKLDLTMEKGNLLVYDYFTIQQEFAHPGDSMCVLTKQILDYGVKFKSQESVCKTVATFTDYNFNPAFPPKFFGNEVATTTKEAYDKDSTYWNESRKEQLTLEEKRYIIVKDSIHDAHNRVEYLDSVDAEFNKVTVLKVLWFGVDHRNRVKKTQWSINSLAGLIQPIYIAGPRIEPGFYYFKKWDNERTFDSYTNMSVGVLNGDIKGSAWGAFRYDPFHFGTVSARFSHEFDVIRGSDAISQIYKRDNFIEVTELNLGHSYEILNGLYLNTDFSMTERRSLEGYKFLDLGEVLPNNDPTEFEPYQAFIMDIELSYTPFQKYMREPNRKVVLGSRWPTVYVNYEKGIPSIFGSDVNHDYISGGITQTFKIGTIGTSSYHVKSGLFLNTKVLKDADQKFHRRSDPIWFSNPLHSFQALDSTMPTQRAYLEAHFVHHDNGSMINKIPFMKKTRIGLVFGVGALYVPEFDWQHYELFAGLERTFKFSKRRLRLGVYGVISDGNQMAPRPGFKVSFALMDRRNLKWNF
jgi:hypothetical protein